MDVSTALTSSPHLERPGGRDRWLRFQLPGGSACPAGDPARPRARRHGHLAPTGGSRGTHVNAGRGRAGLQRRQASVSVCVHECVGVGGCACVYSSGACVCWG